MMLTLDEDAIVIVEDVDAGSKQVEESKESEDNIRVMVTRK